MIPWRLLDTAIVPGGEGSLRLMQRGGEFSIRLDRYELNRIMADVVRIVDDANPAA